MSMKERTWHLVIITVLAGFIVACESGPSEETLDDVSQTLKNLKVDTTITPRVDGEDNPLPESFVPFRKSSTLNMRAELFIAGIGIDSAVDDSNVMKYSPSVPAPINTAASFDKLTTGLDTSWKDSLANDSVAGDFDGDGFQEIAQAWRRSSDDAVLVRIIDDESDSFMELGESILTTGNISWIKLLAADVSGNGTDQLILAFVNDDTRIITLSLLIGDKVGGFSIDFDHQFTLEPTQAVSEIGIEIDAGQLDFDSGEEFVVVINESFGSGQNSSPADGRSEYTIFDDESADFAIMSSGRVQAEVGNNTYSAVVSAVAVGDMDGDGVDEIALAGLAEDFPRQCDSPEVVQLLLDDAIENFELIVADLRDDHDISSCEPSANNTHIEHIWASVLDLDSDGIQEVQVNGIVYESFDLEAPAWNIYQIEGYSGLVDAKIPSDYIYVANLKTGLNDRNNTVITTADVTSDGYDNLIVYAPRTVDVGDHSCGTNSTCDTREYAITIWGIDPLTRKWGEPELAGDGNNERHNGLLYFYETEGTYESDGPVQLVPANVDDDSTILKYSEGSHELVFSEPIVHAALAAPPCYDDGTQVTRFCKTSWGEGEVTGTDTTFGTTISVKAHWGAKGDINIPFVGSVGVEVENTYSASGSLKWNESYRLTKTITYTTGPLEDTVIATVTPYDQYTYVILSHPIYDDMVGEELVVSIPRTPRTMQINRDFYNESLSGAGLQVGSNFYSHVVGDPTTYPSRGDMISARTSKNSLDIGPVDVGAASGTTTVSMSEANTSGFTEAWSFKTETKVKTTGGKVMKGFSISDEVGGSMTEVTGTLVTFKGSVGDMPPDTFDIEKAYSYGMFTYQQGAVDQKPVQVINYWVE